MSDCLVTIATLLYACSNEGTVDEERGKKLSVGKQHALNNFLFFLTVGLIHVRVLLCIDIKSLVGNIMVQFIYMARYTKLFCKHFH